MTNRPYTDMHEIAKQEVESHMRPLICGIFHELEEVKRNQKHLVDMVEKRTLSVHDVVHYVLIVVVFIMALIGLTSC